MTDNQRADNELAKNQLAENHFRKSAIVVTPKQTCEIVPLGADLYERLDRNYASFSGHSLIAMHRFSGDWSTWECHPHGDEIVCLIDGSAEFLLQTESGIVSTVLDSPGSYVCVPANTWHTARIASSATCLFFTPGEGTQNLAQPPGM